MNQVIAGGQLIKNKQQIKGSSYLKAVIDLHYNTDNQHYKHVPLRLIIRQDYHAKKAKRFVINNTNQNVWIPNKHLHPDGTIKENQELDYIFKGPVAKRKMDLAGVVSPIPEINVFK